MFAIVAHLLTSLWGILLLALVGSISGLFLQAAAPQPEAGCLGTILRGFLGALAGIWLAGLFQLPALLNLGIGDVTFPVAYAFMGGILFMLMFRILRV